MSSEKENSLDDEPKMDSTFEALLGAIMLDTNSMDKREEFIRKNENKIVPLFRWLTKMVVIFETNDCDGPESKLSRKFSPENDLDKEKQNMLIFSLDCLLIISSSVTSSIATSSSPILEVLTEEDGQIFLKHLNTQIFKKQNERYFGILVNFTRLSNVVDLIVKIIVKSRQISDFLQELIKQFSVISPDNRHLLAAYLNNLCQSEQIRCSMIDHKLLRPLFDVYEESTDRMLRRFIVELIRNCCLDHTLHKKMIAEDGQELLIRLVLPLAGGEELPDNEMDSLPLDLQYLPEDKQREPDADIRRLLIEAIHQLCATKYGRELIWESNVYYLLREYHKWEPEPEVSEALMCLIDILIKKQSEINVDNLKELDIPEDLVEKFHNMDNEIRNQNKKMEEKS